MARRRWGDNLTAPRYTIIAVGLAFGMGLSLGILI